MKKTYNAKNQNISIVISILIFTFQAFVSKAQTPSTFEDLSLTSDSYWDGSDLSGGFASGDAYFENSYNSSWSVWSGFVYSNMKDITTGDYTNLYSAFTGKGYNNSINYVIGGPLSGPAILKLTGLAQGDTVSGLYVTNTTYAGLTMKNGDSFSKKFGGVSGNDQDWFKLSISGYLGGIATTDTVDFYLADFRFADNTMDYILNNWEWVDLTILGKVDSLSFNLSSSDVGTWGMNTPAYFAIDNFNGAEPPQPAQSGPTTFEDLSLTPDSYWDGSDLAGGFASGNAYFENNYSSYGSGFIYSNMKDITTGDYNNPYSVCTGIGYSNSSNYAIGGIFSGPAILKLTGPAQGDTVSGLYVTNTTYAGLTMKNGDSFSKKFGGVSGNDQDWFKLSISGYLGGIAATDTVDFYLADFRFADNNMDYILNNWEWVDLTTLGKVDSLSFNLSSSDVGTWGMNTPAYFAIDNFNGSEPVFAPQPGQPGTTAMYKDSSAFVGWATACSVTRGLQDISNPGLGDASVGDNTSPVAIAGANGVVSLGDGGSAILTFASPIINGAGNDFAVFENGFDDFFLELAFVEVSSDGINYFRFPATSLTNTSVQVGGFDPLYPTKINNLAGKYKALYGTPFDLEELKDKAGLDVNNITHVRIIDVVGSIQDAYATYDAVGRKVNDPWTTPYASSGFDLDAVGVINTTITAINNNKENKIFNIYPNPVREGENINFDMANQVNKTLTVQLLNISGQLLKQQSISFNQTNITTNDIGKGMYILKIIDDKNITNQKIVITD